MAKKFSPNRRRSIAVLGPSSSKEGKSRRRAYSIAPGEKLSPAAKARRSLMPRKSILKTSVNIPPSQSEPTEISALADDNITQAMEFTEIQFAGRKSLGRRVSFASRAHVRLFEKVQNAGDGGDPPSSPSEDSPNQSPASLNDENAYPGASEHRRQSSVRRRSSTGFSEFGERSMDMDEDSDAPAPDDFLNNGTYHGDVSQDGSAVDEDEFTEEEDDEDMEVTEAIAININRKRSLSIGPTRSSLPLRRPSIAPTTSTRNQSENQIPPPGHQPRHSVTFSPRDEESFRQGDQDLDVTTSSANDQSYISEGASGEDTTPMEFTVPMGRPLRSAEDDPVWAQLAAATHAGKASEPPPESDDEEMPVQQDPNDSAVDMDLTAATQRLLRARESIGLPPVAQESLVEETFDDLPAEDNRMVDDSFTSTEDSFADDAVDAGDRTVNVTTLVRTSLATTDSSMDVSGVLTQDSDAPVRVPIATAPVEAASQLESPGVPNTSQPQPQLEQPQQQQETAPKASEPPRPNVFSLSKTPTAPPRSLAKSPQSTTLPKPFAFSPSKSATPSQGPAAAPSPALSSTKPTRRGTAAFAGPSPRKLPVKRPLPTDEAAVRPSPAKKAAVGKLQHGQKAVFENSELAQPPNRRVSMSAVRRPSGYFAQRKSLGGTNVTGAAGAPKKVAEGLGLGRARASLGAQPSGNDLPLSNNPTLQEMSTRPLYPNVQDIIGDSSSSTDSGPIINAGGEQVSRHDEPQEQATPSPAPTRASPSSASPEVTSPVRPSRPFARPPQPRLTKSPAVAPAKFASPAATLAPPGPRLTHTGIPLTMPRKEVDVNPFDDTQSEPLTVTEQWREGVEADPLDDEGPPISIEQFFSMTGIRFLDDVTIPKPRQSIAAPPQLRSRWRRRSSAGLAVDEEEDLIPLSEFLIALAVETPQLEIYTAVISDLTAWIENSKKICQEAEEETSKVTPELFREFAAADESEQAILIHQLKLIKANNYGTAKSQWYDWKTMWVERLYGRAEQEFARLEEDAKALATVIKEGQDVLPALREEYAQVMAELEKEQADIAEIENSDQDFLAELKASIAEQQNELEAFKADLSEGAAKLERLEEKFAEIDLQKREASVAIGDAQRFVHLKKEGTSTEVIRLRDELEALQDLHLWKATRVTPELVELFYANKFHVVVPCSRHIPKLSKVNVAMLKSARTRERDPFPRFTELSLQAAQQLVFDMPAGSSTREIIELLSDVWSSCAQLRSQLNFLAVTYPLSVEVAPTNSSNLANLVAKAAVLFPHVKGKAHISFILDTPTYCRWPMSIASLKTAVEVAYGPLQPDLIMSAMNSRLAQASSVDSHGCLLDACIEATEQFVS